MSNAASDTHDHGPPPSANPSAHTARTAPVSALAKYMAQTPKSSIDAVCGALGGVASGIVTCPLDVIKTKLQAQGGFRQQQSLKNAPSSSAIYHGMVGTARSIARQDGVRGFYRGLSPMLLGYFPTWGVYMSVYGIAKDFYYTEIDNKFVAQMASSVTAGACSTLATNPIWVIKTRLMAQASRDAADNARTPWHYTSTLDAARKMYAAEGVAAFYSGLSPALLGLTHVAIQFPLYEYFKKEFTGVEMGQKSDGKPSANTLGSLAATAAGPGNVILRRHDQSAALQRSDSDMQDYPGRRGLEGFYNGLGTNLIRAVPAAMTTMLTYETLKDACFRLQDEGRQAQSL
ncbi:hypothetical protein H2203_005837 [Taxawa tesnikishii (nom. ined.)]|nr:hypothetical protein H2203_005837 [Dothideales sp. JES 119]